MATEELQIDEIRIDGGTQPRVRIDNQVVSEYAEALNDGANFEPVVVFRDGANLWLADGFHRLHAHRRISRKTIAAEVKNGTQRDAILYSVGANVAHGQRRSNGDKRKAVATMLRNPLVSKDEHGNSWSNMEIARRCCVSEGTIRNIRKSHTPQNTKYDADKKTFIHHKTGKPTTMKTGNIGGSQKAKAVKPAAVAKKAFMSNKFHGENGPVPMRAISLPLKNPQQAARSMVSLYGLDYMRQLATELNRIIKEREGNSNDSNNE